MSDVAFKRATSVANAIETKLGGKYKSYVRQIDDADGKFSYIELGFRPPSGIQLEEIQVAFSVAYFEGMNTPELMKARAQRILKDVQIALGLDTEE